MTSSSNTKSPQNPSTNIQYLRHTFMPTCTQMPVNLSTSMSLAPPQPTHIHHSFGTHPLHVHYLDPIFLTHVALLSCPACSHHQCQRKIKYMVKHNQKENYGVTQTNTIYTCNLQGQLDNVTASNIKCGNNTTDTPNYW